MKKVEGALVLVEQTIFDLMYPKFKIDKPIRLISLFSGYDSQALALKYLGVKFEHWKTCEWAIKSIQALKDLHFSEDNSDYSATFDIDFIKKFLLEKGISSNYNEPMNQKQISRMSETYARNVFNNIIATRNLVNIQQVKGKDLEIKNTDIYIYIMTYSFPCQDLSLAGKGKGMSDTSTRSGMLWEVERILGELKEKPQVLLMENVPQVHNEENKEDFKKWLLRLEQLGYKNYFKDLIATDYGIPQIRNRCFMISLLGDYSYSFPPKQELKLRLKDMLETNVDQKYYLSENMKQYIFSKNDKYKVNEGSMQINRDIACSKTTREGWTRADTSDYITEDVKCLDLSQARREGKPREYLEVAPTLTSRDYKEPKCLQIGQLYGTAKEPNPQDGRIYSVEGNMPTLMSGGNKQPKILIKNATSTGYLEATEGDGINISSRMEYQRGNVQKDKIQTLTTAGGGNI